MNAPFAPPATWTELDGLFRSYDVRVHPDASYLVKQEAPGRFVVCLPGHGYRKCWNRTEVERVCRAYFESLNEVEDEPDEEADTRSYRENTRWQASMSTYPRDGRA